MRKKKADRRHICEISKALFLKKGYQAVTIDEICDQAGISKPMFYAARLTKSDLLVNVFCLDEKEIHQIAKSPLGALEKIEALCDKLYARLLLSGKKILSDLLAVSLERPVFEIIISPEWKNSIVDAVLDAQNAKQILSTIDPLQLTQIVGSWLIGLCMQFSVSQIEGTFEEMHKGLHALLRRNGEATV